MPNFQTVVFTLALLAVCTTAMAWSVQKYCPTDHWASAPTATNGTDKGRTCIKCDKPEVYHKLKVSNNNGRLTYYNLSNEIIGSSTREAAEHVCPGE